MYIKYITIFIRLIITFYTTAWKNLFVNIPIKDLLMNFIEMKESKAAFKLIDEYFI